MSNILVQKVSEMSGYMDYAANRALERGNPALAVRLLNTLCARTIGHGKSDRLENRVRAIAVIHPEVDIHAYISDADKALSICIFNHDMSFDFFNELCFASQKPFRHALKEMALNNLDKSLGTCVREVTDSTARSPKTGETK